MNPLGTTDSVTRLADNAAASVDQLSSSTQRTANGVLDGLSDGVHQLQSLAVPAVQRVGEQASALAQRGLDAVLDGTQHMRARANQLSTNTVGYIKHEPLKSVLMAAATGAVLMALLSMLRRPGR